VDVASGTRASETHLEATMAQQALRLVGVYDSVPAARAAAEAARRAGVDPSDIRVGQSLDRVVSLEGEMREEMDKSLTGPGNVGPWTKEMLRGMGAGIAVGAVIGAVAALPFAAIEFGDLTLATRLLLVAVVGAFVGATAGWIVGGAFGAKRPEEPLAAERGVTVSVAATQAAEEALIATHPIRLDLVEADGQPLRTITTERPDSMMRQLGRHAAEEEWRG
jgi:hypothetical protein